MPPPGGVVQLIDGNKEGRRNKCLNPYPVYQRPKNWKGLPGAYGRLYKVLSVAEPALNPIFEYGISGGLRKRAFYPSRVILIKQFMLAAVSRICVATSIVQCSLEDIAADLNVTDDRIYRLVNDVMVTYGLMRLVVDYEAPIELSKLTPEKIRALQRFGMVWDERHGKWFPKVMYCTDSFFRVCGATGKLLNEIKAQQELALDDLSKKHTELQGQLLSLGEARNLVRAEIFRKSWNKRLASNQTQRQRSKIGSLNTIDERRAYAARMIRNQIGDKAVSAMTPEQYDSEVWRVLTQFGLAVMPESRQGPPH
jgi:hypothetical protein